ncbi:hypothetical protein P148_SR1C00001G0219 [candidate division SR1 bacterium RAAC1_SR1_1]|nr:hypothetical protein P148_SR1C00001G0219 [candidate division SR1 bacterium RAAC1_SR1_1]
MTLSESLDNKNIPSPGQGLRFVKNEEGVREFTSVDIPQDIDKEPERGIVLVGHIGIGHMEKLKTEMLHVLQQHDEIKGPIVVIAGESASGLENLGLQLSEEQMKELGKTREFLITKRDEIVDTFIFPKTKLPDFKQRQTFHHNQSPKTQYKKGMGYQRTKQRRK